MKMVERSEKSPLRRYVGWVLALVPTVILLILAGQSWADETSTPVSDFLVEFPVPPPDGNPLNIVAEAPGRLWFTMPEANAIGSLVVTSTADYQFELFDVPTPNSYPYDLVYDSKRGGVWFTEHEANKIAFLNPVTETFTETLITTASSGPTGIALSPDDTLWFLEQDANQLANFDPDDSTLDEFTYTLPGGLLEDVVVMDPNSIWFTAPGLPNVKYVVHYVPSRMDFINFPVSGGLGTPSFAANKLTVGRPGQLWASAPEMDRIGLLVPGTLQLWRWYGISQTGAGIAGLAYSWENGQHNLWYTASATGQVGSVVIDETYDVVAIRHHALSSPDSVPIGIAVDSNEQAWIAEFGSEMIAGWYPPYVHASFIPLLTS